MKSFTLIILSFLFLSGSSAQEIVFDDLDPLVQEKLIEEDIPFQIDPPICDQPDDKSVAYVYKGKARDDASDTIYCFLWDRLQENWVNFNRTIKVFDQDEHLIEQVFQFWARDNSWKNGTRNLLEYTETGHVSQRMVQVWYHPTGEWVDFYRTQYLYAEDGLIAGILQQHFNRGSGEWKNRSYRIFTYGEGAVLLADTIQKFHSFRQEWINVILHRYFYNDNAQLVSKVALKKRPAPGAPWIRDHRHLFAYNDSGQKEMITLEQWNDFLGQWLQGERTLFAYNQLDKMEQSTHQHWLRLTRSWMNIHRTMMTYNDLGLISEQHFQKWNMYHSIWVNGSLSTFTRDDTGTLNEKLMQIWHRPTESWMNFKRWIVSMDYKATQAAYALGLPAEKGSAITVSYPNPYVCHAPITITGLDDQQASLVLMDLNGRKVVEYGISGDQQIRLQGPFEQGVYLICILKGSEMLFRNKILIMD